MHSISKKTTTKAPRICPSTTDRDRTDYLPISSRGPSPRTILGMFLETKFLSFGENFDTKKHQNTLSILDK